MRTAIYIKRCYALSVEKQEAYQQKLLNEKSLIQARIAGALILCRKKAPDSVERGLAVLRELAAAGNEDAIVAFTSATLRLYRGMSKKMQQERFQMYQAGRELKSPLLLNWLGDCYLWGLGCEPDPRKAYSCFMEIKKMLPHRHPPELDSFERCKQRLCMQDTDSLYYDEDLLYEKWMEDCRKDPSSLEWSFYINQVYLYPKLGEQEDIMREFPHISERSKEKLWGKFVKGDLVIADPKVFMPENGRQDWECSACGTLLDKLGFKWSMGYRADEDARIIELFSGKELNIFREFPQENKLGRLISQSGTFTACLMEDIKKYNPDFTCENDFLENAILFKNFQGRIRLLQIDGPNWKPYIYFVVTGSHTFISRQILNEKERLEMEEYCRRMY